MWSRSEELAELGTEVLPDSEFKVHKFARYFGS
jgi:hypothetical protein